jgi:[CysO sulfur-carrier protein]-thiocarboxylate-dependent cysteine synthase
VVCLEDREIETAGQISDSLLATIGGTPLVRLNRIGPHGCRLYAKLEGMNPSGSVKDRPSLCMIEDAERRGKLRPGAHILEPTSGNTGLSLAVIARIKGYRLTVIVPDNVPAEKLDLLRLYGAEIILSPGDEGSNGAIARAHRIARQSDEYFMPDQYANLANPESHYQTTACEIIRALPEVSAFVAGLGSGGTLMGVSRRLKEYDGRIDVIAAEPMAGDKVHGLRSLGDGFVPPIFDPERIDGRYLVDSSESISAMRRLLEEEGIFAGPSSGAALVAALRYAENHPGASIVVLLADGGWKYMSTGVFGAGNPDTIESSILW